MVSSPASEGGRAWKRRARVVCGDAEVSPGACSGLTSWRAPELLPSRAVTSPRCPLPPCAPPFRCTGPWQTSPTCSRAANLARAGRARSSTEPPAASLLSGSRHHRSWPSASAPKKTAQPKGPAPVDPGSSSVLSRDFSRIPQSYSKRYRKKGGAGFFLACLRRAALFMWPCWSPAAGAVLNDCGVGALAFSLTTHAPHTGGDGGCIGKSRFWLVLVLVFGRAKLTSI